MSAYRRILVAVDGSPAAAKGLREAIRLAKAQGAQLFILHVVNEFYAYASMEGAGLAADLPALLREGGKRILAKAEAAALKEKLRPKILMRETLGGPAAGPIVREAKKQRADLLVLGTHGRRGLRRMVLGSDAEQVVRLAPVPVLLVKGGAAR
jgi:nucleotide-binding universal stress UspA family protein